MIFPMSAFVCIFKFCSLCFSLFWLIASCFVRQALAGVFTFGQLSSVIVTDRSVTDFTGTSSCESHTGTRHGILHHRCWYVYFKILTSIPNGAPGFEYLEANVEDQQLRERVKEWSIQEKMWMATSSTVTYKCHVKSETVRQCADRLGDEHLAAIFPRPKPETLDAVKDGIRKELAYYLRSWKIADPHTPTDNKKKIILSVFLSLIGVCVLAAIVFCLRLRRRQPEQQLQVPHPGIAATADLRGQHLQQPIITQSTYY